MARREHFPSDRGRLEGKTSGRRASLAAFLVALVLACGQSMREEGGSNGGEGATGAGALAGSGGTASAMGGSGTGGDDDPSGGGAAQGGGGFGAASGRGNAGSASGSGGLGGNGGGNAGEAGNGGGAAGGGGAGDVPGFDDFIVRSRRMFEYEGLRVFATFDQNFGPMSRSDARSDIIADGGFELLWIEGFNRDSFGTYVVLFVDRGDDWVCTPDVDPAWVDFQSNIAEPGESEVLDFDPELDEPNFSPISCDEFNSWFDEDYRPPPR